MQLLAFGMPGPFEWIIIAGLGLLIFGRRLPEVGRSLGKGITEFKKGLKGVDDEVSQVDDAAKPALPSGAKFDPYTGKPVAAPAAKFDPYTGKPIEE